MSDYTSSWRKPFTFDRVVRIVLSCIAILFAIWLVDRLSDVLLPFLVAWLGAYILEPLVQRNRMILHTNGRVIAVILTLFEAILLIVVLCILLLPSIVEEMHQVATLIRQYTASGASIPLIPDSFHEFLRSHIDFNSISDKMVNQNMESILGYANRLISGGVDVVMSVFSWFIVLLYLVFIMIDYDKLLYGFRQMVPPRYRHSVFAIFNDVKDSMNHYFRGQALVASIVGILFVIGLSIVGLPLAVFMGLFIGLLNMVPYLQLISLIPTTLLCLVCSMNTGVNFWVIWWECMAVYVIVQCTQDLFLTPKIMGKAMGLNPAIILLSLSVWGSLLGFIGLIVALPLTTLLIAYYNRYVIHPQKRIAQRHKPKPKPQSNEE